MTFDGKTYDPALDEVRLTGQLSRVKYFMRNGGWHTLQEIRDFANGSEAGVSARIRDLKKARFGGYTVNRRRVLDSLGLWEYQLLKPKPSGQLRLLEG